MLVTWREDSGKCRRRVRDHDNPGQMTIMDYKVVRCRSMSFDLVRSYIGAYRGYIRRYRGHIEGSERCRNDIRTYSGMFDEFQSLRHDVDLSPYKGFRGRSEWSNDLNEYNMGQTNDRTFEAAGRKCLHLECTPWRYITTWRILTYPLSELCGRRSRYETICSYIIVAVFDFAMPATLTTWMSSIFKQPCPRSSL